MFSDYRVPAGHVKVPAVCEQDGNAAAHAVLRDLKNPLAGLPTYQQSPRKKATVDTLSHLCMMLPLKSRLKRVKPPALGHSDIPNPQLDQEGEALFSGSAGKRTDDLGTMGSGGKRRLEGAYTFVDEIIYAHQPSEDLRPAGTPSPVGLSKSGFDISQFPASLVEKGFDAAGWPSWVEPACRSKMPVNIPENHTSRKSCTHLPFTKKRMYVDEPQNTTFFDNVVLGRDISLDGAHKYTENYNKMYDGAAGVTSWYSADRELRMEKMLDASTYDPPCFPCETAEASGCPQGFRTHSPRTWSHMGQGQHPFGHQVDWWPKQNAAPPNAASRSRSERPFTGSPSDDEGQEGIQHEEHERATARHCDGS
jgi:hypothetical protein